jgi:hypothetical protein
MKQNRLRIKDCYVGLEVLLSGDSNYEAQRINPKVGTEFECSGVVYEIDDDIVGVRWRNGTCNSYVDFDLLPKSAGDINSPIQSDRLLIKDCCVGLGVYLSEESTYRPHPSNPRVGTGFECSGVITDIMDNDRVRVKWENGTSNTYKDFDLLMKSEGKINLLWDM